ncbi:hypothetical protein EXIGLDRAFT_523526 [Exidia glandulosa HHB12029]|uniref:Uncharacterized protein n=1 Tax=Exidia glandulosa HHB12029 TaxID=1314781 RepID=A0A166MZB0_EXIGL|nr:hypothetical protein EXIGLDRAFT_523526 [Exidia glandulosa HHB12029]
MSAQAQEERRNVGKIVIRVSESSSSTDSERPAAHGPHATTTGDGGCRAELGRRPGGICSNIRGFVLNLASNPALPKCCQDRNEPGRIQRRSRSRRSRSVRRSATTDAVAARRTCLRAAIERGSDETLASNDEVQRKDKLTKWGPLLKNKMNTTTNG